MSRNTTQRRITGTVRDLYAENIRYHVHLLQIEDKIMSNYSDKNAGPRLMTDTEYTMGCCYV